MAERSPSKEASSLIALDLKTKYLGSVGMKMVSMLGSRPLFMMESSNSYEKSGTLRTPRTRTRQPWLLAKLTMRVSQRWTETFG